MSAFATATGGQPSRIRDEACAICGSALTPGEHDLLTTPCGHIYHKECLEPWRANAMSLEMPFRCPDCRQELHMGKLGLRKSTSKDVRRQLQVTVPAAKTTSFKKQASKPTAMLDRNATPRLEASHQSARSVLERVGQHRTASQKGQEPASKTIPVLNKKPQSKERQAANPRQSDRGRKPLEPAPPTEQAQPGRSESERTTTSKPTPQKPAVAASLNQVSRSPSSKPSQNSSIADLRVRDIPLKDVLEFASQLRHNNQNFHFGVIPKREVFDLRLDPTTWEAASKVTRHGVHAWLKMDGLHAAERHTIVPIKTSDEKYMLELVLGMLTSASVQKDGILTSTGGGE